ncbi:uncharacterized protein [Amphiura filiformis]|uniref:uncharacterized protein n=1 Tax=Amphiura filiformis TaxID=82378 RepID=UPI003B212048
MKIWLFLMLYVTKPTYRQDTQRNLDIPSKPDFQINYNMEKMASQAESNDDPCLQQLIESLRMLVTCAQTHYHNQIDTKSKQDGAEIPTLATLARYYNLKKTNEVMVRVLVILSKLFHRFRVICYGNMKDAREKYCPDFFERLDKESSRILRLSREFSIAKEDCLKMEQDITAIRNSLSVIIQQLEHLKNSQDNNRHRENWITECLIEIDLDWDNVEKAKNELPNGYVQDF